jgi:hypothetical protein
MYHEQKKLIGVDALRTTRNKKKPIKVGGQVFESIEQASKFFKISHTSIRNCLKKDIPFRGLEIELVTSSEV